MSYQFKDQKMVSVIIPTFNSGKFLNECLLSIKKQTYIDIEVIVVDKHSEDDTQDIAKKYTSKIFTYGPERSAQRNYGAHKAQGDYLLFIDSDMVVTSSVIQELMDVARNKDFLMGIIPETSFGIGYWAECKVLEKSYYEGIDWMEAARFFSREVFDNCSGYDESGTGAEDYDLPQRIEKKYVNKRKYRIKSHILHNEGAPDLYNICRKRFYYGQNISNYLKEDANTNNYVKQSSLLLRYKLFLVDRNKLLSKPLVAIGMFFMKWCEFICGATGYLYACILKLNKK